MKHALILNVLIVLAVLVALAVTQNLASLLGLLTLKDMPYGLLAVGAGDDEEEGNPIGFVHHE